MCPPSQARRVLARAFPNIEKAYRESVPAPEIMSFDPIEDVTSIVDRFSEAMDALGGEPNVTKWVEPYLIMDWPGVNKDYVDVVDGAMTPSLLDSIVRQ